MLAAGILYRVRSTFLHDLVLCIGYATLGGLTKVDGSSDNKADIYGTVACIFLFLGSYSIGMTPLSAIYPPEVLSYNMRATGLAWYGLVRKIGGVIVAMCFPYMITALGRKMYITNKSWNILFVVFVAFYWVETKGKMLEEIDVFFDGEKHSDMPNLGDVNVGKATVFTKDVI